MTYEGPETHKDYFNRYSKDKRIILEKCRDIIKSAAQNAEETISYSLPAFRLNGILVYFGMGKNHLGLYPTPSGIEAFKEELKEYKCGKGSVQFPLDKPIPWSLIKKIVKFRVTDNLGI